MATAIAFRDTIDIRALQQTWAAFDRVARPRPIRSEEEYGRTVALMNYLLDRIGDKETHALAGLLDLVGELVTDCESRHFAIEASEPREVLGNQSDPNGTGSERAGKRAAAIQSLLATAALTARCVRRSAP